MLAAEGALGDAQPAWQTLRELGKLLSAKLEVSESFNYAEASDITEEITSKVTGYEQFHFYGYLGWGKGRAVVSAAPETITLQPVSAPPNGARENGDVALLTGRTLFTSLDASAIHSPEADKLHREDGVLVNQYDAVELGISSGDQVVLRNGSSELTIKAVLTNTVPRGAVFVSSYYDGGVVGSLLPSENGSTAPARVKLLKQ
jgi:predicted molibdopterin-dependent oxidoreductase YjgC